MSLKKDHKKVMKRGKWVQKNCQFYKYDSTAHENELIVVCVFFIILIALITLS